jgi:peroxiredoxin
MRVVLRVVPAVMLALIVFMPFVNSPATAQAEGDEIPEFFQDFLIFYSSGNLNEMSGHVHPDRGLVQNGYLLTYEEVERDFQVLGKQIGKIDYIRAIYDSGFFPGENYYRAKCWVHYRIAGYTQQVPTVFVFEKIEEKWYLVQSEMVEFRDQFRDFFEILTIGYILPDIELTTNTNRLYNSGAAAEKNKATLLYFFSLWDIYGDLNTRFFLEMLKEFGRRNDIYIFGVTDDDKTEIDNWMERQELDFVWLYDEKSLVHYDLGILIHPCVLLLDKTGRLVLMGSWRYERDRLLDPDYRTESQELIMRRIAEVLSEPVEEEQEVGD